MKKGNSDLCWAGTCVDARQTIAAPIHAVEALLRTLSFDLLMAAFLPETSINLGTLTEFGTQMTSSQQGASVIRKLTQAQTRLDRSDGLDHPLSRGNSASALSRSIARISSGGGGVLPMMAGRIELLSAEHKGVNERNPRGIPYELGRLFSDTAGIDQRNVDQCGAQRHAQNEFALRHRLRGRAIACGC